MTETPPGSPLPRNREHEGTEERDPSGNRLWSHVLYGGDYSSLRFDHDAEENVYLLEAR